MHASFYLFFYYQITLVLFTRQFYYYSLHYLLLDLDFLWFFDFFFLLRLLDLELFLSLEALLERLFLCLSIFSDFLDFDLLLLFFLCFLSLLLERFFPTDIDLDRLRFELLPLLLDLECLEFLRLDNDLLLLRLRWLNLLILVSISGDSDHLQFFRWFPFTLMISSQSLKIHRILHDQ